MSRKSKNSRSVVCRFTEIRRDESAFSSMKMLTFQPTYISAPKCTAGNFGISFHPHHNDADLAEMR